MDQKQFDVMLSDAETRLRRLKMLYEQWFLGFERTEPAVLRKEFEDLLALLRREQGGNTALRFRLQQLVQRHTTFTTHWRRVGRQIEEGTYQRDVLRARRLKRRNGEEHDNAGPELELSYDVDLEDELEEALLEVHRAAELDAATAASPPPAAPPIAAIALPSPPSPPPRAAAMPPSAAAGATAARPPLGAWTSLRAPANAAARVATAQYSARATPNPDASSLTAAAAFGAALPRGTATGARSLSPFAMPAAIKPVAQPLAAAAANGAPVAKAAATPTVVQSAAVAPKATPAVKPVPAAISGNGASTVGGAFSTDDMQRIYSKYLSARKQNAERVDNVKLDSVEKTIRGMLPQLEKKHVGKKIDFEVVVKDGKVALKPVAR